MPDPETSTSSWEEDFETLVFDRDDVRAAFEAALAQLGEVPPVPLARPRLEVVAHEPEDGSDALLEELPPATLAVLEAARRTVPADAPRLAFAVARPARPRA